MLADLSSEDFHNISRRLAKHLGISRDAAEDLAAHLGDVWKTDDQDHVLIRDDEGKVLARVPTGSVHVGQAGLAATLDTTALHLFDTDEGHVLV